MCCLTLGAAAGAAAVTGAASTLATAGLCKMAVTVGAGTALLAAPAERAELPLGDEGVVLP